jgi:pyrroloquinoline quinone biosynthesis protein E
VTAAASSTGELAAQGYRPFTLVAELTHRCPLACPYCSNPLALAEREHELATDDWLRVFAEAEGLGVVQLHLTGGEPLVRPDLEVLVAEARKLGLFTNLVTSAVPLTRARLEALCEAGLDHVQVSVQDVDPATADAVAKTAASEQKLQVARWVKGLGLPLTLNVVLHRANIARTQDFIALAEELEADRLELANTQYLGWALLNRDALLPTAGEIEHAARIAAAARARLTGRMEVLFVLPDYFSGAPRACTDGWGRRFVVVSPSGDVLPCHAASALPGLTFENVRARSLEWIWRASPSFNAFRGDAWMREPCRTCPRKAIDFGGCRCQAYQLTGDAAATDPACSLSPDHGKVVTARAGARGEIRYLHRGRATR